MEKTQTQGFDVSAQLREMYQLQPIAVNFKGKPREVHFFHRGTSEAFLATLRGASENDSLKRRKRREVCLLAIVLADLHGSSPFFKGLRRFIWRKRLSHTSYSDMEAVQLLTAAKERIQHKKHIEALLAILFAQMQVILAAKNISNEQLRELIMNNRKEN